MPRSPSDPALIVPFPPPATPAPQHPAAPPQPAVMPRTELVARARAGNLEAWARLYQDTFDAVYRHVCYLCGDPILAEDLVQDAYARAMAGIRKYDGRASFVTWVRGIALNVVRMHWRRAKTTDRVQGQLQEISELATEELEREHLQDLRMRLVYEALATLPTSLREAFILRELEGLSTHEAGEQLGISPGNVAVRASRARSRIRREMERRGWLGGGGR